jgi:hypothetical protein
MEQPPKWFMPVAVVALLWNLMGCAMYLMDVMMPAEALAQLPAAQQDLYASRPTWVVAVFAIAVWVGALGTLGLVMRKSWAKLALLASLAAILAQDAWIFGMSNAVEAGGTAIVAIQGTILVIGVVLVLFANTASARGWIR